MSEKTDVGRDSVITLREIKRRKRAQKNAEKGVKRRKRSQYANAEKGVNTQK